MCLARYINVNTRISHSQNWYKHENSKLWWKVLLHMLQIEPPLWPNSSRVTSCAGGPEYKSWVGQILHSVANGSPTLQFLRKIAVLPWRYGAEVGTADSLQGEDHVRVKNKRKNLRVVPTLIKSWSQIKVTPGLIICKMVRKTEPESRFISFAPSIIISSLLDPRLVDPGSVLINTGAFDP